MSEPTYSAAILAGGRATRFGGRDKSALMVDGATIRERQIAALATLTADVMIVGAPAPHVSNAGRTRVVQDIMPGCGPLGGLHAALTAARGDAVLLLACDMPYVTAPLAAYLFSLADAVDVVVPRTERGYHPLCAVYARRCLDAVATRLASQRWTMTELIADCVTRVVTVEELERFGNTERLLANVNTPAEFASLEALQGHEL
jgi:molybdenum cofactor guanylyltransferase